MKSGANYDYVFVTLRSAAQLAYSIMHYSSDNFNDSMMERKVGMFIFVF